ncbi:hypothetical protein EQM13_10765 [Acidilutibacter cellobiosedens]|uniref:beta-lactamase n=1 Tax=Acidilutibacter cellobiosedens TaxID=2507161 RepID=A0A410QDE1_9FIRM|nr:penicillin-binding transpeptidase domain-containing protein [Acidilutibacter cellobiosedens]QAT62033.1 hypothetical protein EQM13_10765 [Acidilutibacter cellobiosedens]
MSRYRRNLLKNRIFYFAFFIVILFIVLGFRLYWVQIIKYDDYCTEALKQRGEETNIYPDRGVIYDKNFIPLTNRDKIKTVFVFRDDIENNKNVEDFVLKFGDTDKERLSKFLKSGNKIMSVPLSSSVSQKDIPKEVFILDKTLRYNEEGILSHVIGYVKESENKGESGIEKVFDDILKKEDSEDVYFELDGKRNVISGAGYTANKSQDSGRPSSVKLTADYHIQKIVENVMDDYKVNGAVIVTEVSTGDIVAMASRPNFNQNSIDTYLNKGNMEFFNKAVQVSYPPGSLFKIVVLLAGLQEDMNLVNKEFYCRGYEQINDLIIKCSKEEGHGKINLKNAFAQSCNSVFIQIGERIGAKKIIEMAKKLGFGEKINIGLMEEVKGNLPEGRELIGPAIGNISIGQGTIEATPLQIANMITIVANNGIKKSLSIVDEIVTEDGYSVKKFNREDDVRIIEQKYCEIVRDYLNEVVISGTAKKVNLEDIGGAGGKTGSAQAILNKQPTIHGWFVGYFPRENPKYTVTILVEEGHSGSSSAVPIFEKIVRKIQEINR